MARGVRVGCGGATGERVSSAEGARRGSRHTRDERAGLRAPSGPGQLDLHVFEQLLERAEREDPTTAARTLRDALALWRGAPLADFAYDTFAQAAIGRLAELRLLALERRIAADLAQGRDGELVPELETLVAEHPLREGPRRS